MTDFFADLETIQKQLYSSESIAAFLQNHQISEILAFTTKVKEISKKTRLNDLMRKLVQTEFFKEILMQFKQQDKNKLKIFNSFIASENSEYFFICLQQNVDYVATILQQQPDTLPLLFSLLNNDFGVKVMNMLITLYNNNPNLSVLHQERAAQELLSGLSHKDSVVSMRFMELVVRVASLNEKHFSFLESTGILNKAINLYDTKDILLKLNVAEIIEAMGNNLWTINYLKNHPIWSNVLGEAFDPHAEFYVKKYLILLIVKMNSIGSFEFTHAAKEEIFKFLLMSLVSKSNQELEAALSVIFYLNRTESGFKLLASKPEAILLYVRHSASIKDVIKKKFVASLVTLSEKHTKPDSFVINLLSCIGDQNLIGPETFKAQTGVLPQGLGKFVEWFYSFLKMPFEDLQIECLLLFQNLVEYLPVALELFRNSNAIPYFRKPARQDIMNLKQDLVKKIMEKGENEWKSNELHEFARVLKQELKKGFQQDVQYELVSK